MNIPEDVTFWNADDDELAGQALIALMADGDASDDTLRMSTERLIGIYELGAAHVRDSTEGAAALNEDRTAFNFGRNIIETMSSKICKARISTMALSEGTGFLARRAAKAIDHAIEGAFDDCDLDSIKEDVVNDSLVTDHGAGFAKVIEGEDDKICIEWVPAEDIRFDRRETRLRQPRSMFQEHDVDKFQLAHRFPEHREAIMLAAAASLTSASASRSLGKNRVIVYEGWHLRSGCDADDGRHVMAIAGATLVNEEYEEDEFPFAAYVPRKRRRDVWGISAMRDIAPAQAEIERLTEAFQRAHQRLGMAGFIGPKGSANPNEIVGDYGIYVEYQGAAPPMPFTVQPVHPDQYAYRETLVRDMGNQLGVTQLATTSQLPAGLQQASGKALQVYEDFESERLLPYHRELERWTVRVAWLVIRTARRMVERGAKPSARYREKTGWRKLDWASVLNKAGDFVLRVFPVSSLSKQPAARFAQLQELLSAGAITVEQFKRLYDIPDLDSELELDTARVDIIDRNLERIVLEGKAYTPEPFDALAQFIERARQFYDLCRVRDVPEDRMRLLREAIVAAQTLIERTQEAAAAKAAAAAPPMPMPQGDPLGAEMPMPV